MGEWRRAGCNMCGLCCNLEMYVEDNHIRDVRPNPDGMRNSVPYCCRKGRAAATLQDDPERLNYPLKKVGDHFERISWDQALKEIGEKARAILDVYGPRTLAFVGGAQAHAQSEMPTMKFIMNALGAQYYYNPMGIEFMGIKWANGRIIGHQGHMVDGLGEIDKVDTFIYWGSNSYVSHNVMLSSGRFFIKEMSERPDKRIITVDPRLSETARMSDMHVMLRPGSDAIMTRGLIALILDLGLEDKEYLDKYCSDWDQAKKWYEGFDYRTAFEVAGVPYEQMVEFAKILTSTTWGCHQDLGIFFGRNNTMSSYLIASLMAVTGNFMYKGNQPMELLLASGGGVDERTEGLWRTLETNKFPVSGVYPDSVLGREMLSKRPDRHRIVIVSASNPVVSFPDTPTLRKGFENADLVVAIEIVPTETTQYADYVLPGMTGYESPQWSLFTSEIVYLKKPILDPIAERRPDGNILIEIGRAMGAIPEMPEQIYAAAAKSVQDRDIVPFFGAAMAWFKEHPEYAAQRNLMLLDAMSREEALGSADRAALRLALITSTLAATEFCDRAGFHAAEPYASMPGAQGAQLAVLSKMDQVFWAVDDSPNGVRIGVVDPDPDSYMRGHTFTSDNKIHLYDETVDEYMKDLTPEAEDMNMKKEMNGFPMLLSSGNHADDGGQNAVMRNPASYRFRKPYFLLVNPEDAAEMKVKDGDIVRIVAERNTIEAPVQVSFKCAKGYCHIPHHYGFEKDGVTFYGEKCNDVSKWEDMDPISGDPYLRYLPCKLEPVNDLAKEANA